MAIPVWPALGFGFAEVGERKGYYPTAPAGASSRREDAVAMQRQARQRLAALLLRNEIRYAGKTTWTQAHRRWIARKGA